MTDEQLLREALEALELAEPIITSMVAIGYTKTHNIDTAQGLQVARAAITKLEQRLLRE